MNVSLLSRAFLPNVGGVETSSAMLARLWREAGHEVTVVTRVPGPGFHEGSRVVRRWSPASLAEAIRRSDVAVTNGYSRIAVAVAQGLRRPLAILHQGYQLISSDGLGFRQETFHDFSLAGDLRLAWREGPGTVLKAAGCRAFDELFRRAGRRVLHVVPSRHVRRRLRLPWAQVMYQPPNPEVVDAVARQSWSTQQREEAYRSGPLRFFGRLVFEKGVEDLVEAFATLAAERRWGSRPAPPLLEIYGEGPRRAPLERLVARHGLESQVRFYPFLKGAELVAAARQASVVVIPSSWEEPGGTIGVEMFLAGAAVVASASGAPGEIFRDHGRIFRNRDAADLARALREHFFDGPRYPCSDGSEPWRLEAIRRTALDLLEQTRLLGERRHPSGGIAPLGSP